MEKSILPNYNVTKKLDFSSVGIFKHETIKKVFQFSYDMSFGNKGEHRDHRSGGKHQRRKGEIFSNTFGSLVRVQLGSHTGIVRTSKNVWTFLFLYLSLMCLR